MSHTSAGRRSAIRSVPAAAAAPFCSNCTLTGAPVELNGEPVIVEPMNASFGCVTNLIEQLGVEEVVYGARLERETTD